MRIASVGQRFVHPTVDNFRFGSPTSLLEYDVAILDVREWLEEYPPEDYYNGLPSLDAHRTAQLLRDVKRRSREIRTLLDLGRLVLVFTSPPCACYYDTGKRSYSGTGRNRHTTVVVSEFDLCRVIPADYETVEASGSSMQFVGDDRLAAFWRANKGATAYGAQFTTAPGKPWLTVSRTTTVVGAYLPVGKGMLVFVPDLTYPSAEDANAEVPSNDEDADPGSVSDHHDEADESEGEEEDEEEYEDDPPEVLKRDSDFIDSVLALAERLTATSAAAPPLWSEKYVLPGEPGLIDAVATAQADVAEAQEVRDKAVEALALRRTDKLLFTASGDIFKNAVKDAFLRLGCEVDDAETGRRDLALNWNGHPMGVEAKGLTKSAAEKDAAQLEKWVSEHIEATGERPKALLVVNGFSESMPDARLDPVFPDQMLGYAKGRDHCLISGLQLLGCLLAVRSGERSASSVMEEISETVGVFPSYSDWRPAFAPDYGEGESKPSRSMVR